MRCIRSMASYFYSHILVIISHNYIISAFAVYLIFTLQLKNAKQMQLAAEAAKRHEEEMLQVKAEKQQQPQQLQSQDHNEHTEVEVGKSADVSKPPESVEQSTVPEKEQTYGVIMVVQPTETDQDTSVQTVADEISCSAGDSGQVAADVNKMEITAENNTYEDAEPSQKLSETDHRETETEVTESTNEVQMSESSEKPPDEETAADETTVIKEAVPVVVVACTDGEVLMTADVSTQSELSQLSTESYTADDSLAVETTEDWPSEVPVIPQSVTDTDKTKLDIADDVGRSVSDESSDAYTDVLEDETDHLSDILDGQEKTKQKEDIEYVELCDESSSTVEQNANKEDNKEETEKELDSILDDVHLDESEHGNCQSKTSFYFCYSRFLF